MRKQRNFLSIITFLMIGSMFFAGGCTLQSKDSSIKETILPPVTGEQGVVAEGHVQPKEHTGLGFLTAGRVDEILVVEGQTVKAGEILIRLGNREQAEAVLRTAESELLRSNQALDDLNRFAESQKAQARQTLVEAQKALTEAKNNLDDIDTEDYRNKVDDARQTVIDARDELTTAQEDFDKVKDLDADSTKRKDAETERDDAQKKYDQAVRDYDLLVNSRDMASAVLAVAEAHLKDAQDDINKLKDGPNPDDLALLKSKVDAAAGQVEAAKVALANMELKAPFSGKVVDLRTKVGEVISPVVTVLVLIDDSAWYVETSDLTEMDVVKIKEGQKVTVIPDALPDLTLTGRVERISESPSEHAGDVAFTARILLGKIDPLVRWGMTVTVDFE